MSRRAVIAALAASLTACAGNPADAQPVITPEIFGVTVIPQSTATPTPRPTPTPNPLAARVNGQPITLAEYEAELARYIAALPDAPDPNSDRGRLLALQLRDAALEALIEQALIEQEAARNGIQVSDQQVAEELAIAKERAGGEAKFQAWLAATRQTEDSIRELLRRELLANAMRDRVLATMPRTAEYVHAYHIVVATEREARQVLARLQNGAKFTALAQSLSLDESTRADGGDLGWFARNTGAVLWPEVEDAAFSLQPGETSEIVKSPIGYHIIRVTGREVRGLTEADTIYLQTIALAEWMAGLKARSQIERFI
ncbi:MAG: SurA N-terminal domain-containing protein [Anaerolineae bacterium]|nr:SurA N-terminal domain-containing protein [Candidatus Roseilinea sp.]MDW8450176.1 SurA N-terminal domain-containing protein [Anaerolineae bacterium]